MPLALSLHLNSPTGPSVSFTQEDGVLVILSDIELEAGDILYHEDGLAIIEVGATAPAPYATIYESRTIQQVLEEDTGSYNFGWKAVELGWLIPFEAGTSTYGQLVALNQNRKGVGVQGPTSIAGTQGSPLTLVQKVNITDIFTQVNGWKSSSTPNSYALDAGDVSTADSRYAYADAFVSWSGETGVVSAPGLNGSSLTEYPATNTVEVEI